MTTATIETLTAAVTTARANLDAAIAAATQWTGQGEVAFCRGELTRAEKALDAAQPAAVEKAAADAARMNSGVSQRSGLITFMDTPS